MKQGENWKHSKEKSRAVLAGQEGSGETSDHEDHVRGLRARAKVMQVSSVKMWSLNVSPPGPVFTAAPDPPGPLFPTGGLTLRSGFVLNLL